MIEGDRKEERRDIDLPKIFPLSCAVLDFEVILTDVDSGVFYKERHTCSRMGILM